MKHETLNQCTVLVIFIWTVLFFSNLIVKDNDHKKIKVLLIFMESKIDYARNSSENIE